MKQKWEYFVLSVVVIGYILWFALPIALNGSESIRIVAVFDSDEELLFGWIKQAIKQRTFFVPFWNYGHFYFNSLVIPLTIVDLIVPITDTTIILCCRLLATLFYVGSVYVFFEIVKEFIDSKIAVLLAIVYMTSSLLILDYSVMIHPDTTQLFFLLLAILFLIKFQKAPKNKLLYAASITAGLAFSAKYSGVFLLPIIVGTFYFKNKKITSSSIGTVIKIMLLFFLAFGITSPALIYDFNFIEGIFTIKSRIQSGHQYVNNNAWTEWFFILIKQEVMGLIIFLSGVVSLFMAFTKRKHENIILIISWLVLYTVMLCVFVKARFSHYLMPVIPFFLISVVGLFLVEGKRKWYKTGVLIALTLNSIWTFVLVIDYRKKDFEQLEEHPAMIVGKWIESNYDASKTILCDKYVYCPKQFKNVSSSWGLSLEDIRHKKPDIVVINEKTYHRYLLKENANKTLRMSKEDFLQRHEFYTQILSNQLAYKEVKKEGKISVYQKVNDK